MAFNKREHGLGCDHRATLQALLGARLQRVRYHRLAGDEPGAWDLESWHDAGEAVELQLDDGRVCWLGWGDCAGGYDFHVEVAWARPTALSASNSRLEVTAHPAWARVLGRSIEGVEVCHTHRLIDRDGTAPVAVSLVVADTELWVVAAELSSASDPAATALLGADNLVVIAAPGLATSLGLGDGLRRSGPA